jgi:excisionase family DNA binding protein
VIPSPEKPDFRLLNKAEVADKLRVSVQTVSRMVKTGELPRIVVSARTIRFRPEDVEAAMTRRK